MAKITVVIPVYKVPFKYLDKCMDSVCRQTFQDIEIIIVDDGSPKLWADKCDEYAKSDFRIKVIHKANGGLSDARNAGLKEATSDWITFVDGDDWIEYDFLEKGISRINNSKVKSDIYYFVSAKNYSIKEVNTEPFFNDGKIFNSKSEIEALQILTFTNFLGKDKKIKGTNLTSAWAKIYNKNFLLNNNLLFPIVPYDEDSLFFLESTEKAKSIEYIAEKVYHYRYAENSITTKYRPNAEQELKIYLDYIENFNIINNKSKEFIDKSKWRTIVAMLLLMKLNFYHPENKLKISKRKQLCNTCFSIRPYKYILKEVNTKEFNFKAKFIYYLLMFKMYNTLNIGRFIKNKFRFLKYGD